MYIDLEQRLSNGQAVTVTANSTNYIDLSQDRDIGKGNPMALVILVTAAAAATGTYRFQLVTDDNTAFSSPTSVADATIAPAALTAGSLHVIPLGLANERYLQATYTTGGTTPSVSVTAWIAPMSMIDAVTNYDSGFTVA